MLGKNFNRGELGVPYFQSCSSGAILSRVCGPCSEAPKVAVNTTFSLPARGSNGIASFGSHEQGHIAPIIRARHLCIGVHTEGKLARQNASEHLSQSVLHKGLSIRFLHRKEYVQSRSLNFLLSMQQGRRNFYNKFTSLFSLKKSKKREIPKTNTHL